MHVVEHLQLRLGGHAVEGGGPLMPLRLPASGEVAYEVRAASEEDVEAAAKLAEEALADGRWAGLAGRQRADTLLRIADLLSQELASYAELDARTAGRPIREMRAQIARLPEWYTYFASIARTIEGRVPPFAGPYLNYTRRVPLGTVALLTPWNHPLLILTKKLAPALAAGCSVLVKPSEQAPESALLFADLCRRAGLPDGVLSVLPGGAETGAAVVSHPAVRLCDLTGGTETGKKVAALAGSHLAGTSLELGGKTPVLIFDDAPLEEAVAGAMFAAFIASGQTCVAGTRLLVQASLYDAFCKRFAERVRSLRVGLPEDPETDVAAVISEAHLQRLLAIVARGEESARLVTGGRRILQAPLDRGYFLEPTVFVDVPPDSELFQEELFGPIVSITPFEDEQQAVQLANDSRFALGSGVWTNDVKRAHRVAERLEAGIVWVNDHHKNDPSSPWGGTKDSGLGSENGWEAYLKFTRQKSTVVGYDPTPSDWYAKDATPKRYS